MEGGSGMSTLITAIGTAFSTVKDDIFSLLGTILPIALGIVGAGLAITFAVKYFKKISNKGN